MPITAIVLTRDEQANLPACLDSLSGWVQRMVIVDSGSVDATCQLARERGAEVIAHPFESHTRQWRWALDHVAQGADWVLGLDADQAVSPELRASITRLFVGPDGRLERYHGFYVNRRQIFRGRWIRHGGYYPKYLLKLFRVAHVQLDPADLMDHHFQVAGPTARLSGDLIERNRKEEDISFWLQKHIRYAELLAREEQLRRAGATAYLAPAWFGSPDQRVVWLKRRWYTLPRYWRAAGYFFYRYLLRLGFLDGREGFVFHALQAFWLRLIVDVQLDQLEAEPRTSTP
ncbi:MAG: glycosyltransferase family 2 protein [Longimicrobiales bacterium]